jgi:cellulose synthase/poly-beta-1,6-N-acetylglucosamine synthase-like glycosyltransferase
MIVFLISVILIVYVLALYPLLIEVWASRKPATTQSAGYRSVSVIIPVHNGGRFLRRKLESVLASEYPRDLLEIIVVSDGSNDETVSIAEEYAGAGITLVNLPRCGKPAALNAGSARASGDILVLTDVRQDLLPQSIWNLTRAFDNPSVGVASGRLLLRHGTTQGEADISRYWHYESWIRQNLSRLDSTFGATGPFYGVRRHLFSPIPEDILLDDVYLPMTVFFQGYRLIVEPKALAYDYPMTPQREYRRKVRTLAGNYQLLLKMPRVLTFRNRMLWHFLSYKVGRLLLPWLFLSVFLASFLLPRPWNNVLVFGQLGAYLLAMFDRLIPQRIWLKRISSPVRTFVVLMIATVNGLRVFFVPPRTLWKVTDIAPIDT